VPLRKSEGRRRVKNRRAKVALSRVVPVAVVALRFPWRCRRRVRSDRGRKRKPHGDMRRTSHSIDFPLQGQVARHSELNSSCLFNASADTGAPAYLAVVLTGSRDAECARAHDQHGGCANSDRFMTLNHNSTVIEPIAVFRARDGIIFGTHLLPSYRSASADQLIPIPPLTMTPRIRKVRCDSHRPRTRIP